MFIDYMCALEKVEENEINKEREKKKNRNSIIQTSPAYFFRTFFLILKTKSYPVLAKLAQYRIMRRLNCFSSSRKSSLGFKGSPKT